MLSLHLWLLHERLRREAADSDNHAGASKLRQILHDRFCTDVELRVHAAGVRVRVGKWLNELEQRFYGYTYAFTQGLNGKEDLGLALWRNVLRSDESLPADTIPEDRKAYVQALVRYVKREAASLAMTDIKDVLAGNVRFDAYK
eukprot:jgi/Chlat1/7004/Chrsp56S09114